MKRIISLGCVLAACAGGDPEFPDVRPRMSSKVSTIERGTTRTEITYRGDQLDRVVKVANGVVVGTAVLTYGPDGVERIDRIDREGDRKVEYRAYDDQGRLVHQRFERGGVFDEEVTLTYYGPRPHVITYRDEDDSSRLIVSYNDQGLTTKQWWGDGGSENWTELNYDDAGRLTSTKTVFPDDMDFWHYYTYVDGRLDNVTGTPWGYKLSYDDAGRITEIDRGNDRITRYTYEAGYISGWSFTPDIPNNEIFDLSGIGTFPITQDDDFSTFF